MLFARSDLREGPVSWSRIYGPNMAVRKRIFDEGGWTNFTAADLCLAMEAARAGIPLICLARRRAYLRALDVCQPDSCFAALCQDDSVETRMALRLLEWKQNPGAFTL